MSRARDVGEGRRAEGGGGEGEVKLGQHLHLTNLCRFAWIGGKKRVFKDLFAPPLVLSSDTKIHSCCKGIKSYTHSLTLETRKACSKKKRKKEICSAAELPGADVREALELQYRVCSFGRCTWDIPYCIFHRFLKLNAELLLPK